MNGLDNWEKATAVLEHVVVSIAAIIGGFWAVVRLRRERTFEAALNMVATQRSTPLALGHEHLVTVTIEVTNKGKTKIQAKEVQPGSGPAFDDGIETLHNSFSLKIRKVDDSNPFPNRHLDWFEGPPLLTVPGLPEEINVLSEYEDPLNHDMADFWMEPDESYGFGIPVVLPEGQYVAKATFIAEGEVGGFWSRVFSFSVPSGTGP